MDRMRTREGEEKSELTMTGVSRWAPAPWWRPLARLGAAVAPLVTCAVLAAFRSEVTAATSVLVLVLWVVAASATGDRLSGLIAAVSAGVWFDFFLAPPYHRFTITRPHDLETAILLVLISLAVTEITLWGHRQRAVSAQRSGYLEGVVVAARAVAEGDASARTVVDVVAREIAEVLGADGARYVDGPAYDARLAVLDHEGTLTRDGKPVDVDRVGLPTDEYVAVLVGRGDRVVGHFLVTVTSRISYPTREQRQVAVVLADQVAAVVGEAH